MKNNSFGLNDIYNFTVYKEQKPDYSIADLYSDAESDNLPVTSSILTPSLLNNTPELKTDDDPDKAKAKYAQDIYKQILLDNGLTLHIKDPGFYDKFTTDKEFKKDINYFGQLLQTNNELLDNLYNISGDEKVKSFKNNSNRVNFLNDDVKGKIDYETALSNTIPKYFYRVLRK